MSDNFCIFSGSKLNLNTSMTIKDGDKSVEVFISDEYLEQATPKNVREAYNKHKAEQQVVDQENQDKMKQLMELANQLGMKVVQPGAIQEPQKPSISTSNVPVQKNEPTLKPQTPDGKIVSGKLADSRNVNVNITGENVGAYGGISQQYEVTSVSKPSENLKDGEMVEMNLVKARGGMDIPIPVKRVGKTGTTTVAIVNTGGDAALQRRFKNMANSGIKSYGQNGYDVRFARCPLCGDKPKLGCQKCGGSGEIQIEQG